MILLSLEFCFTNKFWIKLSTNIMDVDQSVDEGDSKRAKVFVENPYLKKHATPVARHSSRETSSSAAPSIASLAVPAAAPQHAQEKQTEPATTETNVTTDQEKQTFGHKDSAVERLPSRNVSFGSAEILTVSELRKHVSHYVDQSVRITGFVLHRHVANDGNVCLVLKDPSIQQRQPKAPPKSILKTPGTAAGIKRRLSVESTPRFVMTRKRPHSSLKKPPPPSNPIESMVTSLINQQTVFIYAVSKQMPVNDASVGDLVMIIGEVKITPVPAMEDILEQWNAKTDITNSFVYARILRNVNGTDMRLHDEALRMRRKYLMQSSAQPTNEAGVSTRALRPGCGPPPYYDESANANAMNV